MAQERQNYPFTSARQSAERLAILKMDEMITLMRSLMAKLDVELSKVDAEAEGILDLTADVTLTASEIGEARNGNTFTLEVEAAAANPTDTILVDFSGDAEDIVCTVTPNDGTNNSATPVDLTTAELAELINSGVVVGKNVTLSDPDSLRELQTAAGGGATALANAGEGDGEVATFAAGESKYATVAAAYETMQALIGVRDEDFKI